MLIARDWIAVCSFAFFSDTPRNLKYSVLEKPINYSVGCRKDLSGCSTHSSIIKKITYELSVMPHSNVNLKTDTHFVEHYSYVAMARSMIASMFAHTLLIGCQNRRNMYVAAHSQQSC